MANKRSGRKAERALADMVARGFKALALGVAFYLVAFFLQGKPMLQPVAKGLRMFAPWSLLIGAAILAVAYLLRRASMPRPGVPRGFSSGVSQPPPRDAGPVEPARTPPPRRIVEVANPAARRRASEWGAEVFAHIEWRRFEAVCEALFAQAGFQAKTQSHGADGGVDIWLYSRHADGPATIVQCKHWKKQVGVKEVREFLGVMTANGLKRGTFATSSTFTGDAHAFAKANGISTLDGAGLLQLIGRRDAQQQQDLLAVAYEGEYWRPTCASCGIKMVEREPRKGGSPFWGCANYPRCKSTLPRAA